MRPSKYAGTRARFLQREKTCGACSALRAVRLVRRHPKVRAERRRGSMPGKWTGNGECCSECTGVKSRSAANASPWEMAARLTSRRASAFREIAMRSHLPERRRGRCLLRRVRECLDSSKHIWVGQCFTPAPTSSPTFAPTTKSPTSAPTRHAHESSHGSHKLAHNGADEPAAPYCATEVQVDCSWSAWTAFENATCYNATDFEGFDEQAFAGVCLCDFQNCTIPPTLILGMEPAVFGGVVGGASVALVAAAVCLFCAAKRRRERRKSEAGIEVSELPWTSNPMKRDESNSSPLVHDIKSMARGAGIQICTNNPRLASMMAQYSKRMETHEDTRGRGSSLKDLRTVITAKKFASRWKKKAQKNAWTAHVDPSTKRTYYYNAMTKETTWIKPEGFVEKAVRPTVRSWNFLPNEKKDLPELLKFFNKNVWKKHYDKNTQRNYYVNKATKEAVWLAPVEQEGQTLAPKNQRKISLGGQ